jgi:hypothetical protein
MAPLFFLRVRGTFYFVLKPLEIVGGHAKLDLDGPGWLKPPWCLSNCLNGRWSFLLFEGSQSRFFLWLGMAIKPILAGTRPNHTRFDGKNPSWLGLDTGLDFSRFQKTGLGRVMGTLIPTPNPSPNPPHLY